MRSASDLYLGRCAYCDFETQIYDLLERAEADLLSHAREAHTHIGDPRVVPLRDIERLAQDEEDVIRRDA